MDTFFTKDFLLGVVFPYVNLLIFIGLAVKFMRSPMNAFAKSRRDKFSEENQRTAAILKSSRGELSSLEKTLENLDDELKDRQEKSIKSVKNQIATIQKDTEAFLNHLKSEHTQRLDQSVTDARDLLRNEVLEEVKKQVEDQLNGRLTNDIKSSLIDKNIQLLKKSHFTLGGHS